MRGDSLLITIDATHQSLNRRFEEATARTTALGQPRDTYARTDTFMAATSRHLSAVDAVLLPIAKRRLANGSGRVHEYLHQARVLERSMSLLKARLYGEAHAIHVKWPRLWTDVRRQLSRHNMLERQLVVDLSEVLSEEERDQLAQSVYRSEVKGPTRPHPYTPHTGVMGMVARRMWAVADRFWDTAEGRIIPEPVKPPAHKHDSLIAQYLVADPHFDDHAPLVEHHEHHHGHERGHQAPADKTAAKTPTTTP
jgi:hypothetical protein